MHGTTLFTTQADDRTRLAAAAFVGRHVGTPNLPKCGCEPERCSPEQRKALGFNDIQDGQDRVKSRDNRRRIRISYRCDCNGDVPIGRISAAETDGIRKTVEEWTGEYIDTCPWRAFFDPFVMRVLDAYAWQEGGNLSFAIPHPSYRLVQGIRAYRSFLNTIQSKQWELERENSRGKR